MSDAFKFVAFTLGALSFGAVLLLVESRWRGGKL